MSFGEELKKAAEQVEDFDPPDGPYRVKVIDTYAGIARSGNQAPFAKAVLQIIGSDHAGRRFTHFMSLSDNAKPYSAEALLLYGVWLDDLKNIDELSDSMEKIHGVEADITVRHRNGYMNVSVNRVTTGGTDLLPNDANKPPAASFAAQADIDDIPF